MPVLQCYVDDATYAVISAAAAKSGITPTKWAVKLLSGAVARGAPAADEIDAEVRKYRDALFESITAAVACGAETVKEVDRQVGSGSVAKVAHLMRFKERFNLHIDGSISLR